MIIILSLHCVLNDLLVASDCGKVSVLTLLDCFGISGSALNRFQSCFSDRQKIISVNSILTDTAVLQFGVPQGSVLWPILFILYIQPLSQTLQSHCMEHERFADDSQLHRSSQPSDIDPTVLSVEDCVPEIKDRMTDNKLQLNKDKTEAMLFNSSKLQDAITLRNTRRKVIVFSLINIFGPSVWNSLPSHIKNAATITTFKSALKTHFFSLYHSD